MTYSLGQRKVSAHCSDCGWSLEGLNAQGVGAKHSYKTGHKVIVEVYQAILYGSPNRVESMGFFGKKKGAKKRRAK